MDLQDTRNHLFCLCRRSLCNLCSPRVTWYQGVAQCRTTPLSSRSQQGLEVGVAPLQDLLESILFPHFPGSRNVSKQLAILAIVNRDIKVEATAAYCLHCNTNWHALCTNVDRCHTIANYLSSFKCRSNCV